MLPDVVRLRLSARFPRLATFVIHESTDGSGSTSRCRLECEPIDGPAPMVQQHCACNIDCPIWDLRAVRQSKSVAFWCRSKDPIEIQFVERGPNRIEHDKALLRREKAFQSVRNGMPADYRNDYDDDEQSTE